MARIAANDVEKILVAAQDAALADRVDRRHSADYADLVDAFRRAAELRDKPFGIRKLRSKRGEQLVLATHMVKTEKDTRYVQCLLPLINAQRTYKYTQEFKDDSGKVLKTVMHDSGIVPSMHLQWVRADRLEAA